MDEFWSGKVSRQKATCFGREYFQYDVDVTEMVREIMGDEVVSAHIRPHKNNCEDDFRLEGILDDILAEYQKYGVFRCDYADMSVSFKNGRTVLFENSEYGSMKRTEKE